MVNHHTTYGMTRSSQHLNFLGDRLQTIYQPIYLRSLAQDIQIKTRKYVKLQNEKNACDLIGRVCQASVTSQQHEQLRRIMRYVCCKELKSWCKSFTRTEELLSILEAILLGVLISFLVFLILHFLACRPCPELAPENDSEKQLPTASASPNIPTRHSTLSPHVECTWEPSQTTTARTRYYLSDRRSSPGDTGSSTTRYSKGPSTTTESLDIFDEDVEPSHGYDDVEFLEHSDGEPAEDRYKNQVVALVKVKPPGDVTFGCILTKITKFWTLTAASCIESIEEVDSLDSFVIMEGFGSEGASRPRTVADVRLHPQYAVAARAHDLAALRADRALRARALPLRLPRLLDYFLVALGEKFYILGYGGYRIIDKSAESRQLRQVSVFVVPSAACAAAGRAELWAPRHLLRGQAARHGACGAAPLCAGARFSRVAPCNYCAGTPLLRDHTLFGVMSDNSACGVTCEPQLYVNIATLRDWIDSVIE